MSKKIMDYIGPDEMVFGEDMQSGGFSVNSIMKKAGLSPIVTLNANETQKGGEKVSDMFQDLVIPNYVLSYRTMEDLYDGEEDEDDELMFEKREDTEVIDDELYNQLLELVMDYNSKLQRAKRRATKRASLGKTDSNATRRQKSKLL